MANLNYISSFINFGQTRAIKRAVPSDLLAKKKQLLFNEGLRPIAASIKEDLEFIPKLGHCALSNLPQACSAAQRHVLLSF